MRTLEQERAKFAYDAISEVKKESSDVQNKYSSYVKNASVLILSNGLSATLAFYLSKIKMKDGTSYKDVRSEIDKHKAEQQIRFESKPERVAYAYLFCHISEWLAEKSNNGAGLTDGEDPLTFIIRKADVLKVMQLTQESLALLNWMKRFADAMLEREE
jgi:CRISPR-associated protein Cmr5